MRSANSRVQEALENVAERFSKDGTGVFDTGDLSTAGKLTDEQADRFLDEVQKTAVITQETRNVRMNAPKRLIEKIGFSSRILKPAETDYAAPTSEKIVTPGLGKVTLSTVEVAAYVDLSIDTLEDNIERGNLENHIVSLVTAAISRDLEEMYLLGDTSRNDSTVLDLLDGWLVQTATNVVDGNGATITEDGLFGEMLEKLPAKYQRSLNEWRFYVSHKTEFFIRRERAGRQTGGGDLWLTSGAPLTYAGIPIVPVHLMPEAATTGDGGTRGFALLAHPKNIVVGVQRDVSFHNFYNGRRRVWEMTWTMRVDTKYEFEDATVKAVDHAAV